MVCLRYHTSGAFMWKYSRNRENIWLMNLVANQRAQLVRWKQTFVTDHRNLLLSFFRRAQKNIFHLNLRTSKETTTNHHDFSLVVGKLWFLEEFGCPSGLCGSIGWKKKCSNCYQWLASYANSCINFDRFRYSPGSIGETTWPVHLATDISVTEAIFGSFCSLLHQKQQGL
jgi:hypothetical protein